MKAALAVITLIAVASAGEVAEIREWYTSVNDMISSGGLYTSELSVNSEDLMYPAVGIFDRTFTFYWDLDDENYPAAELLCIKVLSHYSAVEEYEEYLFNRDGELVFHFRSGGYDMNEERYYFDGDHLLRYCMNDQVSDSPDEGARIGGENTLLEGAELIQAFDLIHQ